MKNKKYYIWVLGCQMNLSDAERVSAILEKLGYKRTEKENEAGLIVVLACSVRQSAIDRIYGWAKRWKRAKNKPITILSGCVLPHDVPKMGKIFDLIFEMKNLDKLAQFLNEKEFKISDYFKVEPLYESKFQAFIPIMTGCNNFCSYCAVPYTKGREISRPEEEILTEIKKLIKKGYKEIILLGQNVNSYGNDLKSKENFPRLLEKINNIPGKFWVRFISSNPYDMSDKLIKAVKNLEKATEYIHLPVQSGNNEILKKMNRRYTREHYLKLVSKIKKEIPEASITTDTIVGFPGETEKQFKDTANLYKEVGYDMAYISQYSPRAGTVSYKMKDDVSRAEKKKRDEDLTKILRETALKNNKKYIGKIFEVLTEKNKGKYLFGRTRTFKLVQFKSPKKFIGNFIKVKIKSVTPWAMKGEVIKKELA